MKVKDLKRVLEGVDDDLVVLLPGGEDHSYLTTLDGKVIKARKLSQRKRVYDPEYVEWDENECAEPSEECVDVFVIW